MNMIDTHAHLFSKEFDIDIEDVVKRSKEVRVKSVLLPNIDVSTISKLKKTTNQFPDFFLPMMGLHPTSVDDGWKKQLELIQDEVNNERYIAIGEIGIDLHWDDKFKKEQIIVFEEQLKWSSEMDLPVSIHFRDATEEVVKSIQRVGSNKLKGVFHSFGGNSHELNSILQLKNFLIGINGVVTYKNSGLDKTLIDCPAEYVVMETDSPYLSPVPHRGKRNESSYIYIVLNKLAEIWKKDEEKVALITTANAERVFSL